MQFGQYCLLTVTLLNIFYAYKFTFDLASMMKDYGYDANVFRSQTPSLWPAFVTFGRFCAAGFFTIAFLAGHVLMKKPSAGIRTNLMFGFLCVSICLHRIYVEGPLHPDSSAISVQSAQKNLLIQGSAFLISLLGLLTVTDPLPKDKSS